MKKLLLPILLALIGLGGGIAGGTMMQTPHEPEAECLPAAEGEVVAETPESTVETLPEFIKMNNQFVVPVMKDGAVQSMVVLSLSLETGPGKSELVYQREPKLRDALLRVLFDHANTGGFDGNFTDNGTMRALRTQLLSAAQAVLGKDVSDVLIIDIVRQDAG